MDLFQEISERAWQDNEQGIMTGEIADIKKESVSLEYFEALDNSALNTSENVDDFNSSLHETETNELDRNEIEPVIDWRKNMIITKSKKKPVQCALCQKEMTKKSHL